MHRLAGDWSSLRGRVNQFLGQFAARFSRLAPLRGAQGQGEAGPGPSSPALITDSESSWSRSARAAWASSTWPPRRARPPQGGAEADQGRHGLAAVLQRFEAERQALAMINHPNIARVFDAGTDPDRPALLRHGAGERHADRRGSATRPRLTPRERLELFVRGVPGSTARPPEGSRPP